MKLQGKRALVSGGAIRLGKAMVLALAKAETDVIIHYNRSATAAEATCLAARALGVQAATLQADLSEADAVRALAQNVLDDYGGVDILINNADPFIRAGLQETSLEQWHSELSVQLDAPFLLAQGLAPTMQKRGGGLIINILDNSAFGPSPAYLAHGIAKHGLWGLTQNMAVALAPDVRVNAIVLGPILPPAQLSEQQKARIAKNTLLQRWGKPEDLINALRYLIQADYVTGEVLFVDGGERWC